MTSRFFCAVLLVVALTAIFGLRGIGMAEAGGNDHVSLGAYPEAVLSAVDEASGVTVSVDANGTGLTARDSGGAVLWQVDILEQVGPPSEGAPVIRDVDIRTAGVVSLVVGKSRVVDVDLKTGKAKSLGED